MPQGVPKSPSRWRFWDTLFLLEECEVWSLSAAKHSRSLRRQHCSSLCLQSEGSEDGSAATAKSVTLFAINTSPSLCKQSELQCCAAKLATMLRRKLNYSAGTAMSAPTGAQLTKNPPVHILNRGITYKVYLIFTFHANGRLYSPHKSEFQPCLFDLTTQSSSASTSS